MLQFRRYYVLGVAMKVLFAVLISFFMIGCSSSVANIPVNSSNYSEFEKLLAKKDKKIDELNQKIADLEAQKVKYQSDLEEYNNNPVLDELDELLSSKDSQTDSKE